MYSANKIQMFFDCINFDCFELGCSLTAGGIGALIGTPAGILKALFFF